MDSTASAVYTALPTAWQHAALLVLAASYVVSHLISCTATPAPNTLWGRVYSCLEMFAGIYGKAKQAGIPVVTAQDVVSRLGAAMASGQTLTPEALADILGTPAAPQPVPQPVPQPAPAPQPVLQPVPQPVPQAVLQPAPQPVPQPVPQPAPAALQPVVDAHADIIDAHTAAQQEAYNA